MTHPFGNLVSVATLRTRLDVTSIEATDTELLGFMFQSYKSLVNLDLPVNLNGMPLEIVENSKIFAYNKPVLEIPDLLDGYANYIIQLDEPLLNLVKVEVQIPYTNPASYTEVPVISFKSQKFGTWIETGTNHMYNVYSDTVPTDQAIVRVTYTTGITDSEDDLVVREDLLKVLEYLYRDHGKALKTTDSIGSKIVQSFRADDTSYTYSNPGVKASEYLDQNPYIARIVSKYQRKDKHIF